jgi:hypothetical protein
VAIAAKQTPTVATAEKEAPVGLARPVAARAAGQPLAHARTAPCADAGATMTAAHAVDNASNGLTAGRREQYPQGPLFKRADQTSERASLIADINALLNELDAETATETPRFEGRGSQPPALQ